MQLREALTQIAEIRQQMARAQMFRGFRSATVAFSGILAVLAGGLQAAWLPQPAENVAGYLTLWVSVAAISLLAAGWEIALRTLRTDCSLSRQTTRLAVEQFAPCIVAGGLVTAAIARHAPQSVALLPGLWAILLSLGILACCRLLPRSTFWVGVFYLAVGVIVLVVSRDGWELSPWFMAIPFGVGQLSAAAILYWTLERSHEQE